MLPPAEVQTAPEMLIRGTIQTRITRLGIDRERDLQTRPRLGDTHAGLPYQLAHVVVVDRDLTVAKLPLQQRVVTDRAQPARGQALKLVGA